MKHVIALSGGKDSTAMALRLVETEPRDYEFICTPTGDELPEMRLHWDVLEILYGLSPLRQIQSKTLNELIDDIGMLPNWRARWCTRILKIEPMIDYMNTLPQGSVMYVGLRADEEERPGLVDHGDRFEVRFPMRDWGWGVCDVLAYLERRGVTIPKRTDCARCFFQTLGEWKTLHDEHPEVYAHAEAQEEKLGHTFRSPGRDTWPAPLKDLRAEFAKGRRLRKSNARNSADRCVMCSI